MKTLRPLTKIALLALALGLVGATVYVAQKPSPLRVECPYQFPDSLQAPPNYGVNGVCHPYPQPRLSHSTADTVDGVIKINTGTTFFAEPVDEDGTPISPFTKPPGTNFLPNIYTNMYDGTGKQMLNTLPSTPTIPYNLHDGDPVVSTINPTSPTDDLARIFADVLTNAEVAITTGDPSDEIQLYAFRTMKRDLLMALNILEGYPIPNRAYSGFPLLHYTGPEKIRRVTPIRNDTTGKVVGGNIDLHQIWYDSHIESDLSLLNPVDVWDVPWTMTYTIDMLHNGHDDFSPFAIFTDDPAINPAHKEYPWPPTPPPPGAPDSTWGFWPAGEAHIGMDQSFFPMEDGTRTVFKIKMPPGKYYHLLYTWGWRMHPPRIQATDRATKKFKGKTLVEWETDVFGEAPIRCKPGQSRYDANGATKCYKKTVQAIDNIGDYSPAKQMWKAVRNARMAAANSKFEDVVSNITKARAAFFAWKDRTILPCFARDPSTGECIDGLEPDPTSDLTILFVNNTIYGQLTQGGWRRWPDWNLRYTADEDITLNNPVLDVTVYNGDYFEHSYVNVDFGGSRGWENQFKSSIRVGGSGCWFTFGRANWWVNNTGVGPIWLKAANGASLTMQKVQITYNYEPSLRLRFYQFDPLHHDVAIYSIH